PFLDKLTETVMFSPSLQKAVEHDYVQPMGLEETQNGITVRVEHVIVDQKQVNVFYTVSSDRYNYLVARPDLLDAESGEPAKVASVYGNERVSMGEMRHILADFGDTDVLSQMRLCVDVMEVPVTPGHEEPTNQQWDAAGSREPIASFDFLMTFDPTFTATGKVIELNRDFVLDGNRFSVSQLCIYPSHIRIQIEEDPDNLSWIRSLHFYLELEDGTVIAAGGNGISAFGNADTPSMTTYMAESSYFYDAECFRLVVTGADFLEKDFGKTYVNLEENTAENLPEGHEFVSAAMVGACWELEFLHPDDGISHVQVYGEFYDREGNRISTDGIWWSGGDDGTIDHPVMRKSGYRLKDFSGSEVWIEPHYSYFWYPDVPVVVEITP
ncbi:MAG: DUF4179 domain-containing protein, partial [Lachnospiraceae bacterium]|nr:DUF4179 domain-containing protein [Lachnospiraceae bacterium]